MLAWLFCQAQDRFRLLAAGQKRKAGREKGEEDGLGFLSTVIRKLDSESPKKRMLNKIARSQKLGAI